jgi:Na+/H+ antiporter NhaD/arsenite permease-like protein
MNGLLFAAGFDVAPWAPAPFVLLLLCIAILPMAAGHWWHSNRNRLLVSLGFALPVIGYLIAISPRTNGASTRALVHELQAYASFVIMLGSLYTISGGIVLAGALRARPSTNLLFLAIGTPLANIIGTTGASMLLIRPLLKTNQERRVKNHIAIFFIFTVSNTGGLLTPLGDPPLFLGFLNGVPFEWTLRLWPEWLLVNGLLLALFYVWDNIAYNREKPEDIARDEALTAPLKLRGWKLNTPLLLGVVVAVVAQKFLPAPSGELLMLACGLASLYFTPKDVRELNRFSWGPILEVAILFFGIFVCMVPALAVLQKNGAKLGIATPMEFYWVTGLLSSVLDNAPTYVTLGTLATTVTDTQNLAELAAKAPHMLAPIACGAVCMGALTYIGNGPNFMVKAIAEESGYVMPSFFGYAKMAALILLPIFLLVAVVFF